MATMEKMLEAIERLKDEFHAHQRDAAATYATATELIKKATEEIQALKMAVQIGTNGKSLAERLIVTEAEMRRLRMDLEQVTTTLERIHARITHAHSTRLQFYATILSAVLSASAVVIASLIAMRST